jgi:Family of unknown function (DUF5681)
MKSSPRRKFRRSTERSGSVKHSGERVEFGRDRPNEEYRVGPGRPPREFQFKPGQSGNPTGVKRKKRAVALNLKSLLERALDAKVTLRRGEGERITTKAAAGIEKLTDQFVKGDPRARRDLFALAKTLGIDVTAGQSSTIANALAEATSAEDRALLEDYVRRRRSDHQREDDQDVVRRLKSETQQSLRLLPKLEG